MWWRTEQAGMDFENEGKQLAFDTAGEEEAVESTQGKWGQAKRQAREFIFTILQYMSLI